MNVEPAPPRVEDAALIAQIGTAIHDIRKGRGLTIADLAARSGVGTATIAGVENGSENFGIVEFQSIATALETSIARIARRAEHASHTRRSASRRLLKFRSRRHGR